MNQFTHYITAIFGIACMVATARFIIRKWVTVVIVPLNHSSIHSRNGKLNQLLESGRYRFFGLGHQFQVFDKRPKEWVTPSSSA